MPSPTAPMPSASLSRAASVEAPDGGFGVYVHWPFCLAKCPYCDFNSHVVRHVDQARWAKALRAELRHMRTLSGPLPVRSVFFGGGTPSLMAPATVAAVLDEIAGLWPLEPEVEVSLEANPTSVEAENFKGYAAAGVNRLSLGVQSLNDADLKGLGRLHSAEEARGAIRLARAHFERMSFDLIYARPGQTLEGWREELDEAIALAADHLSLYQLTIEEGTPFEALHARGSLTLPAEDLAADFYALTGEVCGAAGLLPYEVSNHARPGAECRHNLVYWRYGLYAGIGPGAHGRLLLEGRRHATTTLRQPGAWLEAVERNGHGIEALEEISDRQAAEELVMMGLRLDEGVPQARFEALNGAPFDRSRLGALVADGLLEVEGGRLRATSDGRLVLNGVLGALLA